MYIYTHTHTHTHTCINIYTYIYIQRERERRDARWRRRGGNKSVTPNFLHGIPIVDCTRHATHTKEFVCVCVCVCVCLCVCTPARSRVKGASVWSSSHTSTMTQASCLQSFLTYNYERCCQPLLCSHLVESPQYCEQQERKPNNTKNIYQNGAPKEDGRRAQEWAKVGKEREREREIERDKRDAHRRRERERERER